MLNQETKASMVALERVEPGTRRSNKRHIMGCALTCFENLGLESTRIEDIRHRANSSIGSIYHHFGNKDGLVAALYFAALDDQLALIEPRVQKASTARDAVDALIRTYLSWVEGQPQLARFMFQARHSVAAGPRKDDLAERNKRRYGALHKWLRTGVSDRVIRKLPGETYASLLVGQSENYCRAWLSGRVRSAPSTYADIFTDSAWRSVAQDPHA